MGNSDAVHRHNRFARRPARRHPFPGCEFVSTLLLGRADQDSLRDGEHRVFRCAASR